MKNRNSYNLAPREIVLHIASSPVMLYNSCSNFWQTLFLVKLFGNIVNCFSEKFLQQLLETTQYIVATIQLQISYKEY